MTTKKIKNQNGEEKPQENEELKGEALPEINADICPTCGQKPAIKMEEDGKFTVYCETPHDTVMGFTRGGKKISYKATGDTPEEAVQNWNEGTWND